MKTKGPYKVLSSKTVYKNPWIEVKEDKVIDFEGQKGLFGTIDYGSGVSIAAINKKNEIFLIKEYFYALGEYGIMLPSGGINKDEKVIDAAKRELFEETGATAEKWIELGISNPLTMIVKSPAFLFLALRAKQTSVREKGIEVLTVPFEKAVAMVMNGNITHAGSCNALLKAKIWLDKNG